MGTAGQLVVKRYRLVRAHGHGAMGIVWEGHDTLLDRPVAVREVLLPVTLAESKRLLLTQRLAKEARQAERLRHPNAAAVYDVAEEDGTLYVVMEPVQARSLEGIVKDDGPLSPERAAQIGRRLLSVLTHAHSLGVRHGDVRPVNVLIGHDGRVVLTDFGTAPLAADPAFAPGNRRMQAYLAPERKDTEPTPAADLWSLGATLHYAVTGTPPDPAARSHDEVPVPLRPVVNGLLARDPKKRLDPQEADRLLAALEPAQPAPAPPRRAGRTRRIAAIAGITAGTVVVAAAAGWVLAWPWSSDATPTVVAESSRPAVSPSPVPSPTGPSALRLTWYRSPAGWRAAVPRGWTRQQDGEFAMVWIDPKGRANLRIEVTAQRGTDALAALREAEAILEPTVKGYRSIRLTTAASKYGDAADWEFTWTQRTSSPDSLLKRGVAYHQLRRVISTANTTGVLTWTTKAEEWERMRPTLTKLLSLFRPAAE
ncbi:hypothetical protein TBS_16820 [Thermobispora bispora]|uniref:non-specific serine/threonine protein kinase n=1 Tax=Thermobispora bispora (strain ATCC 19993 / DSM 43833 / CBS 139.67 / JCM 10125 / KCTC 9307 / NBRC 14880 / R51) TaxID=469371 RepID=D6YAF1_THEBD|nr:serine/threonine-protein kinase [Thermobispora bispora]ADG90204.1 serine/threonine protein kinase [Thermobispora bispora DSM 43833]